MAVGGLPKLGEQNHVHVSCTYVMFLEEYNVV